ncbi:sugar ABC transporter substrate-binding protein [Agromyces intestinalis]|uniref:Sugar ABC transporter substrate-binding protein n=1 Tax=Agromyces intestinalis TaxID=2592652 RepID=A0A5C1YGF9_9MICO|nr:sugar ABC transporter substrate-binding protein [Agromyces intestinalis]QEO14117.1 sugar ABC transporter substrate-binding protein [Agromyces intestinalis]
MTSSFKIAGAITALALAVPLAGCATAEPADDGRVTLQVAIDAGLDDGAIAAFEERAAQFEKQNPDITIESVEYTWDGTTFAAALAGGTLPDVFTIPFTDGRGLIANEQLADISKLVAELPYAGDFNQNVAVAGQAADGSQWAVPIAAYGQGLHYNRTLFEQAGLDPDQPPTTWDEVRADAKQIADATGVAGYAQMTSSNTGGWILTTLDYALGGRLEQVDGDEVTSTIDTPEMTKVLEMVKTMRWEDNSMGANFLYDWGSINQAFASGQIGMYVSGGGNYGNLFTQNQMNPDDYGLTVLPLADSADAGVLGGGTLAVVSANATEAEQAAGVKWIDFYYMQKLADEDAAVTAAKTTAESGAPVGAPEMPIFDEATYAESQRWIADYVNVPLAQMTSFTDHIFEQPLLPEPGHHTQEVYAILDPVIQAVLTDQNADIAELLADAEQQAQQILAG